MIIKNHTIELNDTSASEMARFRQIMLNIWRQQIEDDRNAKIMVDSFKSSQITNTAYFISIVEVIDCIKRNIKQIYPKMLFSDFIGLPNSTPEKTGIMFYNDSHGTQKTGAIHLEWNYFLGLNLIPKTFKPNIKIGKYHTEFTLAIFDHNLEKIAFKFIVYDFDHFLTLLDSLGVIITSDEQIIIDLYRKKIKEANDNPNKLDVIYESLPKTLFGKMDDEELYRHLNLILKDNSLFEGMTALTDFDTNEDKAVLQILYAIKDRQKLYLKLKDTDLLYEIYSKLHGEEVQDLLRFLTRLVSEFDNTKPTETVYFDNSYYLFRDTHIKTEWSGKTIILNNYKDATQLVGKPREAYNPKELDRMYPPGVSEVYIPKYYILNRPFNPLAKLNFGTKLGELGEQVGDDNTFVLALKIHNMSTKQSNWDLFNVATDLLSLLSAYGALRILLAKGAPIAARTLAGVVLAKDVAHYAMLSNDTLQKLHDNGYGWLANLWIGFSVTVDLFSFGLPNMSKIAREGNAAAELSETVEDAKEIKKVTDEANKLVKAETGKDVCKMTEKEFKKFLKENQKGDPEQYAEFIDTAENILTKKVLVETKFIQIPLGESKMSKLAIEHRKSLAMPKHGGNIAVFKFIDTDGAKQYKAISTEIESTTHAEILGMKWLRDNNIPYKNVKKIYSELEPCSLGQSQCKKVLKDNFPNIKVEYSYKYPGTGGVGDTPEIIASRLKSRTKRQRDLDKLIKE
ncbi:nucleic acid/nucleotide deaminase domain-containing protein [Flavobacterium sp. S87F.05.LMB.W.Kidney.N]|uniref:nucleic acid/nucleotide deaminase domain-containing protein n=1 Tax=Flavobacterium sp. S87F.05.LMB.W.Kidney.N TaxID=1278758 RepID=UPI00106622B6|nr:nucleic acid/nucleotide deaminase domain-containing protein [Flavobacterium sp. S87F.05.LMB.W.Kidney.N]TDX11193.1 nucleic acid/nucleotide deaminase of polymorphic system toxin [Flavobacterium sp. S87F.05.LMB.W.Kidney.N]